MVIIIALLGVFIGLNKELPSGKASKTYLNKISSKYHTPLNAYGDNVDAIT